MAYMPLTFIGLLPHTLVAEVAAYEPADRHWPMPDEPYMGNIVAKAPADGRRVATFFVTFNTDENGNFVLQLPPDISPVHAFEIIGLYARSDAGFEPLPLSSPAG